MLKVCPVCRNRYDPSNIFCPADGSTLRADEADQDLIGTVVADRYLVTDLLGEGGMGRVYLARHVRLPQQAAIKVLRPELLADPAAIARFNREAANACRIEHERVARVFDFGETSDGIVYLAMEFVAGDSLKGILDREGPLSIARTAAIVRQIADGLEAAHHLGIVHRDLKPDNILVAPDEVNGGDRCKVVDFGIAKAVGSQVSESALTRTGFVLGTPEFMSPEQLLGGEIDQRSDVYALALVAYQCLTGELPFDSNTPDRGMTARLVVSPRPLHVVRPDRTWPPALQQLFDDALQVDVAARTGSAAAFARAFEAAQSSPHAGAMTSAARRDGRRFRVLLPAVAVVALGAAVAVWVADDRGNTGGRAVEPMPPVDSTAPARSLAAPQAPPVASPAPPTAPNTASRTPAAPGSTLSTSAPAVGNARATLDSVTAALDPTSADRPTARAAIPVLRSILRQLPTGTDSTWAFIRLAEAHLLLEEIEPACTALGSARTTARTTTQTEVISRYSDTLGCRL